MFSKTITISVSNDLRTDQRIHRISKSLSENGYRVQVIGFGTTKPSELPKGDVGWEIHKRLFKRGFLFYSEVNLRLFFLLLFRKSGIYCACDADTLLANFFAARLKGKKLVFDAHEFFSETSGVIDRAFVQWIWKKIENLLIPRVDLAYTVSQGIANQMKQRFGKEFQVIMNVPKTRTLSDSPFEFEKGTFWIYQGALNKGRGLHALIEAIRQSDKILVIAGRGPLEDELKAKVKIEGLDSKVKFMGQLEPRKLAGLSALAYGGFNLVEGTGLSYRYSLANKFFDYMAAGIPQINCDLPEYRMICKEFNCSDFVEEIRPDLIAKAIEKLEKDRDHYGELRAESDRAASIFNWEVEEKKLIAAYQDL